MAWRRTVAVAQRAEELGFESVWLFDHFHTVPRPTDEITFESFTSLSALAALTERVRVGQIVICNGFRNPALTAKMAGTLDTISDGRFDLGIGAGWKRDEWLAYGYGFPETRVRLEMLRDGLEVITRMLAPGGEHATFEGEHASVTGRHQPAQGNAGTAHPDHGRRQRPEGHLAPGGAFRGRAERRWAVAGRPARGAARNPIPLRGDRARPGQPEGEPACLVGRARLVHGRRPAQRVPGRAGGARPEPGDRPAAGERDSDEPLVALAEDARAAGVALDG